VIADFMTEPKDNPTEIDLIAILGLYNSGSSALAGVLYYLGVQMEPLESYRVYESAELSPKLREWWCEPRAKAGVSWTELKEGAGKADRIYFLKQWIEAKRQAGIRQMAIKHPLLLLSADDLLEACGTRVRFIWSYRRLNESIDKLTKREWWPGGERFIQTALWNRVKPFVERLDRSRKLIIAYNDITDGAKTLDQLNQISKYLKISPTEKQKMDAFNFIRKSLKIEGRAPRAG
jgi:hypothetical protein